MSKRLFLKQLLTNPRAIGAACPSSQKLADQMASYVPHQFEGSIVELGPGTGVVTEALLKRGIPPHRIIAIEYSYELIKLLKKKFPHVNIIHGDACHLREILKKQLEMDSVKVEVIVSSLPFKSLPSSMVRTIANELDLILTDHGRIIQFSYDLRKNSSNPFTDFKKCHTKIIWQNLPPARVSVFERKNGVALKH